MRVLFAVFALLARLPSELFLLPLKTSIEIDCLYHGIERPDFSLTRARFEELCEDLFRSSLEPVEKALRKIHD